jgi:hypothetical protein
MLMCNIRIRVIRYTGRKRCSQRKYRQDLRVPNAESDYYMSIGLEGVRTVARWEKTARFTELLRYITLQLLVQYYFALRQDASCKCGRHNVTMSKDSTRE